FYFLSLYARKQERFIPRILRETLFYPGLLVMITISLWIVLELFRRDMDKKTLRLLQHGIFICWIIVSALLISRLISLAGKIGLRKAVIQQNMDYSHRKARTKFVLIQRILNVLLFVGALSLILMTFKSVRQVGTTLLASAGVLGIIIGFAA